MPTRLTPRHQLRYYLMCVDKAGFERREEDGTLLSERIGKTISAADSKVTDVFVMSHGWKGDVPAAIEQYDRWIDAMADCGDDRARARVVRPGFAPLLVGFHWPSLPFGEDAMGGNAFDAVAGAGEDVFVDKWAERIAETPAARAALHTIFNAALDEIEPERLSAAVVDAYRTLDQEAGLGAAGLAAAPDADRADFDPQQIYLDSLDSDVSYGDSMLGGLLAPLRQLSFWTMKKRARICGETAGHRLLAAIRKAGDDVGSADLRIHLMGHSFGCIVVSSMLRGTDPEHGLHVSSALLVQGAMSLWSFAKQLPTDARATGWFWPVLDRSRIAGALVVTTSRFDRAVGSLYPLAAGAAGQVDYRTRAVEPPKYGALGAFGACGEGLDAEPRVLSLGDITSDYNLASGHVYNANGDAVIRTGGGLSGAHSDIAHAEIGHLFWDAVLAAP